MPTGDFDKPMSLAEANAIEMRLEAAARVGKFDTSREKPATEFRFVGPHDEAKFFPHREPGQNIYAKTGIDCRTVHGGPPAKGKKRK